MAIRFYVDGVLNVDVARKYKHGDAQMLDRVQRDWEQGGLHPLTPFGDMPTNNAYTISRPSRDLLLITTTEGHELRWEVLP